MENCGIHCCDAALRIAQRTSIPRIP